jgi:transposase-like protein
MRKRTKYTAEEKVRILRRHFIDQVSVSDLCDEIGLQPTVFYRWQKQFFENGSAAFERVNGRKQDGLERRNVELEEKLRRKNEVLSELMEEHVQLKKSLGEL